MTSISIKMERKACLIAMPTEHPTKKYWDRKSLIKGTSLILLLFHIKNNLMKINQEKRNKIYLLYKVILQLLP